MAGRRPSSNFSSCMNARGRAGAGGGGEGGFLALEDGMKRGARRSGGRWWADGEGADDAWIDHRALDHGAGFELLAEVAGERSRSAEAAGELEARTC